MYMIVDGCYVKIFEDEKIYDIISVDWVVTKWTRFEKYYQPHQVYWYLRLVVNKRILTYFANIKKEREEQTLALFERAIEDD
jgi:hypothetical protein